MRCIAALSFAVVAALAACGDATSIERIEGVPGGTSQVPARTVVADADVGAMGIGQGAVVVGVGDTLLRSKLLGDDAVITVPVVAAKGEPTKIGLTSLIARRGNVGYLALSDHGLFHDTTAGVAVSPFSTFVAGKRVHSIDVTGEGTNEALWIVTADGGFVRRGASVVALAQSDAKIEALIGLDDHRALAWAGGELATIDVNAGTKTNIVPDVAPIAAFDRGDDGTIWLATTAGLYARTANGVLTQRTFAAAGDPPRAVRAVSAGIDRVVALVGGDAIAIADGEATVLVAGRDTATSVAVDANGDVWIAAPRKVERLALGKPTSFAVDIAPFMVKHCQTCHANGAKGAPKRAFDDYETARAAATEIGTRLRGAGRPVMPPSETERLAPQDYRVVLRWIAGGTPH